jgi:hypothetical protein
MADPLERTKSLSFEHDNGLSYVNSNAELMLAFKDGTALRSLLFHNSLERLLERY